MKPKSHITWFEEEEYIGTTVSFPAGSVWKMDAKVDEHEYYEYQQDVEELGIHSEARAVFLCSKLAGNGPSNAIIKMRLQIPWAGTAGKRPSIRAKQATSKTPSNFKTEISALSHLTKSHCSSTPSLLDWKKERQADNEWVPGGYKLSILMERLPGSDPTHPFICGKMDRIERDALRAAFKTAWIEATNCGVTHGDQALGNLLWDKENNKCYLIDWEYCYERERNDAWRDDLYLLWNLASLGTSEYQENMDTWDL